MKKLQTTIAYRNIGESSGEGVGDGVGGIEGEGVDDGLGDGVGEGAVSESLELDGEVRVIVSE